MAVFFCIFRALSFERNFFRPEVPFKLPQQIIYHRKGNLSESPNHFKYRENVLISRFYEQFSRSSRNLGYFWKFEKIYSLHI